MVIFLLTFLESDLILKEIKVQDNIKTNFLDLVPEKPVKISFYEYSDSVSKKILMISYYKNYVNIKTLDYDEFQRRLTIPVLSYNLYENKRVEYLIGQTLLGIGIYSWTLPLFLFGEELTDETEERIRTGTGLIFPFFYFGVNYLLTNKLTFSSTQAYASFCGGVAGFFHGIFLFNRVNYVFPISIAENILDNYLSRTFNLTTGSYQRKLNHNIYGYYHYRTIITLLKDNFEMTENDNTYSSLISIFEGYTSLFISRNKKNVTFGDALIELRTTILGSELIPSLLWTYDNFNNFDVKKRSYAAGSLLGHLAGYWVGNLLSEKNDVSTSTAFLCYLIPSLAHLFTLGIISLSESETLLKAYPTIFLVTDIGLTYIVYSSFRELGYEGNKELNNIHFGFNIKPDIRNKGLILNLRCHF